MSASTSQPSRAQKRRKAQLDNLELELFGVVANEDEQRSLQQDVSDQSTESDRSGTESEEEPQKNRSKKQRKMAERMAKLAPAGTRKVKLDQDDEDAVWSDEDDQHQTLSMNYLRENAPDKLTGKDLASKNKLEKFSSKIREQFVQRSKLGTKPEWLSKVEEESKRQEQSQDGEQDSGEDDDALEGLFALQKSTGKYLGRPAKLPKTYLQANKLPDPTLAHQKSSCRSKVVLFHPTEPVVLTANTQGAIQLHQVCRSTEDLQANRGDAFLQEVKIRRFRVDSLDWFDSATAVFVTSNRNQAFYDYNLMNGQVNEHTYPKNIHRDGNTGLRSRLSDDGNIVAFMGQGAELHLFARAAMEHLHTFVASTRIVDARFAPRDPNLIFALCESGECFVWNLKAKGDQHVFVDQGCVRATCLAIAPNAQFLAIGQNTGIVNVYTLKTARSQVDPKPVHTYTNLTTSASFLSFSHDSEMLAFGSDEKAMAYRIAHVRTGTVFLNFPPKNEMLGKSIATCADFSPHSAFVAFGTNDGALKLYRLSYFGKY